NFPVLDSACDVIERCPPVHFEGDRRRWWRRGFSAGQFHVYLRQKCEVFRKGVVGQLNNLLLAFLYCTCFRGYVAVRCRGERDINSNVVFTSNSLSFFHEISPILMSCLLPSARWASRLLRRTRSSSLPDLARSPL